MKFQIKDAKKAMEWIELLKMFKSLSNDVTITCTPEKMFIQLMDMSHVCLVNVNIPSSWFHMYESDNYTFSVSIIILVKVLCLLEKVKMVWL